MSGVEYGFTVCYDDNFGVGRLKQASAKEYRNTDSHSIYDCAAQCMSSSVCLSFSYNKRVCQLLDIPIEVSDPDQDELSKTKISDGFLQYDIKTWPHSLAAKCSGKCPEALKCAVDRTGHAQCSPESCGHPPDVAGARVNFSGHLISDQATYTCERDYMNCFGKATISMCQSTGRWENMARHCEQFRWRNPNTPMTYPFPCGKCDRFQVHIECIPTKETQFTVEFPNNQGIDVHISFRIQYGFFGHNRNITVLNDFYNGKWGREKSVRQPIVVGELFHVIVSRADSQYTIKVNDKLLTHFQDRHDGCPNAMKIWDDVSVNLVEFK